MRRPRRSASTRTPSQGTSGCSRRGRRLPYRSPRVECPGCQAGLFIVLGERGFFSTGEDYALSDDDAEGRPPLPSNPAALEGIGHRLHDTATSDSRHEAAHALPHVFGHVTCPDCETRFSAAGRISAPWSATR